MNDIELRGRVNRSDDRINIGFQPRLEKVDINSYLGIKTTQVQAWRDVDSQDLVFKNDLETLA